MFDGLSCLELLILPSFGACYVAGWVGLWLAGMTMKLIVMKMDHALIICEAPVSLLFDQKLQCSVVFLMGNRSADSVQMFQSSADSVVFWWAIGPSKGPRIHSAAASAAQNLHRPCLGMLPGHDLQHREGHGWPKGKDPTVGDRGLEWWMTQTQNI